MLLWYYVGMNVWQWIILVLGGVAAVLVLLWHAVILCRWCVWMWERGKAAPVEPDAIARALARIERETAERRKSP